MTLRDFLKPVKDLVFGKTIVKIRKRIQIKPVATEKKKSFQCWSQIVIVQIYSQKFCLPNKYKKTHKHS